MWAPEGLSQRGKWILFSIVFTPSPLSHPCLVWFLPVISILLTNIVTPVRACLIIWLERFRGTKKEDDRGPINTLEFAVKSVEKKLTKTKIQCKLLEAVTAKSAPPILFCSRQLLVLQTCRWRLAWQAGGWDWPWCDPPSLSPPRHGVPSAQLSAPTCSR